MLSQSKQWMNKANTSPLVFRPFSLVVIAVAVVVVAAVNVCRRRNIGRNEAVVAVAPDNNNFIDKDVIVPVLVGS